MSEKLIKRVTAYYPVEDVVMVELLLEVDAKLTDKEIQERVENSDLEYFDEDSGIELQSYEIVDRDYSTDPTDDWRQRISVGIIEDWEEEDEYA